MKTSPKSQSLAVTANLIALVCSSVSFLALTIALYQIFTGHHPNISAFAVMFCTLPVTIFCTIVALILVGFRESKFALIAIGIYALQFILGYISEMILQYQ